jgi:RecG-like helicase
MSVPNSFPKQFTKAQITRLNEAGMENLYSLITYFPFRLQTILPYNKFSKDSSCQYLFTGTLVNIEFRKVGKGYFLIDLIGEMGERVQGYLFQSNSYIWAELKTGLKFQWIFQISTKGFLNILKWSAFKGVQSSSYFTLGSASAIPWLVPVYSKIGQLTSAKINSIHQKISPADYILNLEGLIPENKYFSSHLDLSQIHKPSSQESFTIASHQWIAFKLFLRMATYKQIKLNNQVLMAKKSSMNLDTLKLINGSIPFELTLSQKNTVWNILKQVGEID